MFKKGFTLIELLVVIAIIAILAAILFPVFAQAREKARQASCLSNTKQIGTALQLYIDDYDETVPIMYNGSITKGANGGSYPGYPINNFAQWDNGWGYDDWTQFYWSWMDSIFPYVKNIGVYKCPSAKNDMGVFITPGYSYNFYLAGGLAGCFASNGATSWQSQTPSSLSEIANTSEIVFCTDAVILKSNPITLSYACPLLSFPDVSGITTANYYIPPRHIGGQCFTFCDGHAKYYKVNQGPLDVNHMGVKTGGSAYWGALTQYWDPKYY